MQRFTDHKAAATAAAFVNDNKTLVSGGSDDQLIVNAVSLQRMHVADDKAVSAMSLSQNGAQYATANADGSVKTWDINSGNLVRAFAGLTAPALAVSFNPNNQQVAEKSLVLWNAADGAAQLKFAVGSEVTRLAYSPDGKKVVAAAKDLGIRTFSPVPPTPKPGVPVDLSEPTPVMKGSSAPITGLAFAPDNRTALSVAADGFLRLWPIASPDVVLNLTGHQSQVYCVAFSPDGKLLASASNDKTVRTWDLTAGKEQRASPGQGQAVYSVAFSPDGTTLITGGGDKTVRLYDVASGSEVRQFAGSEGAVYTAAFHPQGQMIAAAGVDKKIRLWNLSDAQLIRTLTGHTDDIYRVQFNPTGTRLMSVGYSGAVNVWDVSNPEKPLFHIKLPVVLYSAGYFPDGRRIAATANDGKTHIIDLPPEAL
jgi:WD40 repeat protein